MRERTSIDIRVLYQCLTRFSQVMDDFVGFLNLCQFVQALALPLWCNAPLVQSQFSTLANVSTTKFAHNRP